MIAAGHNFISKKILKGVRMAIYFYNPTLVTVYQVFKESSQILEYNFDTKFCT